MKQPPEDRSQPGRVMQFRADCKDCGATFPNPLLGDFAYGEFLLRGEHGKAVVYLNTFAEPAWDMIVALVPPVPKTDWDPAVTRLHRIVAACADPVLGERLTSDGPICPRCESRQVRYGDGEQMGVTVLPTASFDGFLRLNPEQRAQMVSALVAADPLE